VCVGCVCVCVWCVCVGVWCVLGGCVWCVCVCGVCVCVCVCVSVRARNVDGVYPRNSYHQVSGKFCIRVQFVILFVWFGRWFVRCVSWPPSQLLVSLITELGSRLVCWSVCGQIGRSGVLLIVKPANYFSRYNS
jgi:hypothetical protein